MLATILWEKCGHCVCKGCSIGVKACHVCGEPVLMWSRIDVPIKSALSELNDSGTQESVVQSIAYLTTTPKEPKETGDAKTATYEEDDAFDSDNDEPGATVTWCSTDIFLKGGARSASLELEPELPALSTKKSMGRPKRGTVNDTPQPRLSSLSAKTPLDGEDCNEPSRKKRTRAVTLIDNIDSFPTSTKKQHQRPTRVPTLPARFKAI